MAYEYPTNYNNGSIVDGPGDMFMDYPTSVVPNYGNGILILVFLVVFAVSSIAGALKGFVAALFITSVLSIYLAAQGWVNMAIPFGLSTVLIIIIIIAMFEGKSGSTL